MTATAGTQSPLDTVLAALDNRGSRWRHSGGQVSAQCPSHDDAVASLTVRESNGRVLIHCHSGCDPQGIVSELRLEWADLFEAEREPRSSTRPEIVATYDYTDTHGTLLFQKVRLHPKDFRVRCPAPGTDKWIWKIGDTPRVLYRLPQVMAAIAAGETVWVTEGERDADRLAGLGLCATCNFEGASKAGGTPKWRAAYTETLRGAAVVVIADHDEAGYAHARSAAASLTGAAASVRIVRGLLLTPKADISDHLDMGFEMDEVVDVPPVEPAAESAGNRTPDPDAGGDPQSEDQTYPEPRRVATVYHPAPLDCLPTLFGEFVVTVSASVQCVPEIALFGGLGSLSFATGGTVVVAINGDHHEPLTIWGAVTALPSERKSGAVKASAGTPLAGAVDWFWEDRAAEQEQVRHRIEIAELKIKRIKSALAGEKPPPSGAADLAAASVELAELADRIVHRPVWDITDATVESLEEGMADEGGAVGSFADEAALLTTIAGRYSVGGKGKISLGSMNQAHSRGTIHVWRRGSARRCVREPHLVLCQIIQPDPFAQLMGVLRVQEDGFLSRWLYANPRPYGLRKAVAPALDTGTQQAWVKVLATLLRRFWGNRQVTTLNLTEQAWAVYQRLFDEVAADVEAHKDTHGTFSQWLGKGANAHTVRVAALFELAGDPEATMIGADSMRRAVTLYRWLRVEAMAAMDVTSGDTLRPEVEREVLAWIARRRARDVTGGREPMQFVQARDLKRCMRKFRDASPEEAEAIFVQLEDQDWLRRTDSAGRFDARTRWQIRPDFEGKWAG